MEYLVSISDIKLATHQDLASFYKSMKLMAEKTLNAKVIGFEAQLYSLMDALTLEIEEGRLATVALFDDAVNIVGMNNDSEGNQSVFYKYHNHFLHDKERNVVVGFIRNYSYSNFTYIGYIFAENEETMMNYLQYLKSKIRDLYKSKGILVLTDTPHGPKSERQEINKEVSRENAYIEEDIKEEILNSVDTFFSEESSKTYKEYNIDYRRGIMLYGKPGNGKTTLIKSIVNSIKAPVVYWQVTEATSSGSISDVFAQVKLLAPVLLVIEDMDSLPNHCRSTFLNQLDGTKNNEGIFIIGTTNYPDRIDPAIMNRAGRFDRAYEIKTPTDEIKVKYLIDKGLDKLVSEDEIKEAISKTKDFSIASLNEIYTSAVLQHIYNKKVDLNKIIESLKEISKKQADYKWFDDKKQVGFM